MAAYSALVSLARILHQILHPPPLNKILIDRPQTEFLLEKVNFMIHSLETHSTRRSSQEVADLETKIAGVAYAAEDLIESNVMEQILANDGEKLSTLLCEGIQTVLEKFLSIEKDLILIEEDARGLRPKILPATTSSSPPTGGKKVMVGLDKHVTEIMGALATDESNRQIIPIVGMGGVGKTTLAIAVYNNPYVVEQFHVRAWVTVSQEYTLRELLIRLLSEVNKACPDKEDETDELGLQLYQALFDRKYLIVLDDMWHIEVWDKLRMFFPRNDNGSRILVTTRLSNLADDFGSCPFTVDLLDEGQSWNLLCKTVFADEDCPVELEDIGEDIAEKCGGLPLALVVIGGLLGKLERTREHWESVAGDVASALNYGNDEHVMEILSLSYVHLPLYLKPCFLYLAMFPEDFVIYVTRLIKLWLAEGLIKHNQAKCLEDVAREYLEDLISRNLILVDERGSSGKVNGCRMHDLIRDLCTMEAEKEKFLYLAKLDDPNVLPNMETERRLSLSSTSEPVPLVGIEALQSTKYNRSLLSHCKLFGYDWWIQEGSLGDTSRKSTVSQIIHGFGLLKVLHVSDHEISFDLIRLRNLRYVFAKSVSSFSSLSLCWNIQSLEVIQEITLPAEIWQMPQLRHLKMSTTTLPDPPDDHNLVVLENLQTLANVKNFKCAEQVLKRIPNLRKLKITYDFGSSDECEQVGNYCLENLVCFKKLESLQIGGPEKLRADLAFPLPLKKLTLAFLKIPWDDLSIVGSLPNLEVLKLYAHATEGDEWNPVEGEFCRLRYLMICTSELRIWGVENYHFPVLERLVLSESKLEEIPMSFAEIMTLNMIELYPRDSPLLCSAKEISDERELLGYEPLQISSS